MVSGSNYSLPSYRSPLLSTAQGRRGIDPGLEQCLLVDPTRRGVRHRPTTSTSLCYSPLRLETAHFYFTKKLYYRRALRYPYDGSNALESWVSSVPGFHDGPLQFPSAEEQSTPDLILGKGSSRFLKDGKMETIEAHRFTFLIPRT